MRLLLTSSGNTNKSIENALSELLGKPFLDANLVFVPTAANVEEDISGWLKTDITNFQKLGFNKFDVIDISKTDREDWLSIFKEADVFVFGGGNEKYLLEWIRKTGIDKELQTLLKSKVYVGISAGSMVTAKNLSLADSGKLYYEDFDRKDHLEGLGYIPFEIRPHLNSEYFKDVTIPNLEKIAGQIKHPFYAIDDNTAVQVVNSKVTIISEGEWKKFDIR